MRFSTFDGTVQTLEGPVACDVGDTIPTGQAGEHRPVVLEIFENSHEPLPHLKMGEAGSYRKRPLTVQASQVTFRHPYLQTAAVYKTGSDLSFTENVWHPSFELNHLKTRNASDCRDFQPTVPVVCGLQHSIYGQSRSVGMPRLQETVFFRSQHLRRSESA